MLVESDAIQIHARASRAWFGVNAAHQAERRANHCREQGDDEGAVVWERVKSAVEEMDKAGEPLTMV